MCSVFCAVAIATTTDPAPLDGEYRVAMTLCGDSQAPQPMELADAIRQSLFAQPQLIIAQQELVESQSDVRAAVAPFLPSAALSVMDEKYVPANGGGPVVVIGNNVLGGPQTRSGYGSVSLSWNIMNSGRDIAGLRGAKAGVRAASSGLDSQLEDSLSGVLQAYADLYEAEVKWLMTQEWARHAEDVLWRRTKLGLKLTPGEAAALEEYMRGAANAAA